MNNEDERDNDPEPTELFKHHPAKITSASIDPRIRHALPTMAMIGLDKAGGKTIMADDSLSQYSSRLSQNAVKRGFPVVGADKNPEMKQTSTTSFQPLSITEGSPIALEDTLGRGLQDVPDRDVARARGAVRNMLRPATAQKQIVRGDSQFEQLRLDV